ncbi:uncharacterized protein LOC128966505 [Oppia nitens]|uniref:uncharacterized protein LOC128966505 n=1 Tax=Oppia nitens TaxID=1686743 RepID=UPI0023DBFA3C|nr:uncharacterized protein LOC128966505 [Oppia nitens]
MSSLGKNEVTDTPVNVSSDAISVSEEQPDDGVHTINSDSIVSNRMTIAGGFLDVALFVADVEHLKFIFDTGRDDIEYYNLLLGLLFTSLVLQIAVGILIFIVGFSKTSKQTLQEAKWTKIINHVILGMVVLIAVTNIFVTSFGDRGNVLSQYKARHDCKPIEKTKQ